MKIKENKSNDLVKVSKAGLLTLVTSKLKGRVFFPKKVEAAKEYLQKIIVAQP